MLLENKYEKPSFQFFIFLFIFVTYHIFLPLFFIYITLTNRVNLNKPKSGKCYMTELSTLYRGKMIKDRTEYALDGVNVK